jgi:hypothetical protein
LGFCGKTGFDPRIPPPCGTMPDLVTHPPQRPRGGAEPRGGRRGAWPWRCACDGRLAGGGGGRIAGGGAALWVVWFPAGAGGGPGGFPGERLFRHGHDAGDRRLDLDGALGPVACAPALQVSGPSRDRAERGAVLRAERRGHGSVDVHRGASGPGAAGGDPGGAPVRGEPGGGPLCRGRGGGVVSLDAAGGHSRHGGNVGCVHAAAVYPSIQSARPAPGSGGDRPVGGGGGRCLWHHDHPGVLCLHRVLFPPALAVAAEARGAAGPPGEVPWRLVGRRCSSRSPCAPICRSSCMA